MTHIDKTAKRIISLCRTTVDVLDELDRSYSCTDPIDDVRDCGECEHCRIAEKTIHLMRDGE